MSLVAELTHSIAHLLNQKISHVLRSDLNQDTDSQILCTYQKEITDAHVYLLCSKGKLIRPLCVLLMAGCVGGERAVFFAQPAAASVECVHTYSLVHDDLPCMDNDTLRRGQPTTHVVYGEAKGLLVGDGLLTAAFEILSENADSHTADLIVKLTHVLSRACGGTGMILGQWLDISEAQFPPLESLSEKEKSSVFHAIHKNKTGKLFAACFQMGFLCGLHALQEQKQSAQLFSLDEKNKIQKRLYEIGLDIGLSFQIMDDILDVTQNSETLGKTSGKDTIQNKWNAVSVFGLENAKQYANEILNRAQKDLDHIYKTHFICDQNSPYFESLMDFIVKIAKRNS